MTIDIPDNTLPLIPTTDPELLDGPQLDPIVIPYRAIVEPVVGRLTHVEVGRVDVVTLAWAGVDDAGSERSGTASLDVDVCDDGRSLVLGWRVEVDETAKG
jgi:hypothetical protein